MSSKYAVNKHIARSMYVEREKMDSFFILQKIDTFISVYVGGCSPCKYYCRNYFFYQKNGIQYGKYYYNDPKDWSIIREKKTFPIQNNFVFDFFSSNSAMLVKMDSVINVDHYVVKYELHWRRGLGTYNRIFTFQDNYNMELDSALSYLAVNIEKIVPNCPQLKAKQRNLSYKNYKRHTD